MKNVQHNSRRWAGIVGTMCLLAVTLSSCLKNSNTVTPDTAALTVINASPDAPALDFYLDANKGNAYAFGYGSGIDYVAAYAGHRTATFTIGGTQTSYKSDTLTLGKNKYYSLFLTNTVGHEQLLLLSDTIARPDGTKAGIRFINLSPDAPAVDLAIKSGDVLVANKSFKGYSKFLPINGTTKYTFEIRQTGTATVLATIENVTLNSNALYTVSLQGLVSATDVKKLVGRVQTNAQFY